LNSQQQNKVFSRLFDEPACLSFSGCIVTSSSTRPFRKSWLDSLKKGSEGSRLFPLHAWPRPRSCKPLQPFSDEEVIEASTMDRPGPLVLDGVDAEKPPKGKGTLVAFGKCLNEAQMDQCVVERTVEVARRTRAFACGPLLAVLDRSSLWRAQEVPAGFSLRSSLLKTEERPPMSCQETRDKRHLG
jgi:hypothetical protein